MPDKFTLSQVNLHYDAFHALKDVNLNLPEKAITAFIGPSGCGKSTLLKSLNRMNDLIPGLQNYRHHRPGRAGHLRPADGREPAAQAGGHGVPKAQPLPHDRV